MSEQNIQKIPVKKRTLATKLNPHTNSFANISLILKEATKSPIEENEFKFLLATAVRTVHGEFAGAVDVLKYKTIDSLNYTSIIRFKTAHQARIVTALLLFGQWQGTDCRLEVLQTSPTPCFLAIK